MKHYFILWNKTVEVLGRTRAGVFVIGFLLVWASLGFFSVSSEWLDRLIIDWVQLTEMRYRSPHSALIQVDIDNRTLDGINERWPWPRSHIARLIEAIELGKPRTIILDMVLQHPDRQDSGNGDSQLVKTMQSCKNIGLVFFLEQTLTTRGRETRPFKSFQAFRDASKFEGFVWAIMDGDYLIRSFACTDGRLGIESCALKAAKTIEPGLIAPAPDGDDVSRCLLSFAKYGGGIPHVSAIDLWENRISSNVFYDKIVVFGGVAAILHDQHRTSCGLISGPEILATSIDTILRGRASLRAWGLKWRLVAVFLGGVFAVIFLGYLSKRKFLASFGILMSLFVLGILCSYQFRWFPPWGSFILAWVLVDISFWLWEYFMVFMENQLTKAEGKSSWIVQSQFFPKEPWVSPEGFSCRGLCIPCSEVGGDYFDYISQSDGSLIFLISDVSGHGFPAAMVTAVAKTITTMLRQQGPISLVQLFKNIHSIFHELLRGKKMMTFILGHLEPVNAKVTLAFGGHNPAYLVSPDRSVKELGKPCFPAGVKKNPEPKTMEFTMEPGSKLVLYTDGIIESMDWQEKVYGFDRWQSNLGQVLPGKPPEEDLEAMLQDVHAHQKGKEFTDDVTILLIARSTK